MPHPGAALAFALGIALSMPLAVPASAENVATLSADPARSTDGVYQLEWTASGPVRIEESAEPDFRDVAVVYEGTDRATTLSGRLDGVYHYRLRSPAQPGAAAGAPSEVPPVRVEVVHHPLSRAFGFFLLGLVVFASTVGLVLFGDRRAGRETERRSG